MVKSTKMGRKPANIGDFCRSGAFHFCSWRRIRSLPLGFQGASRSQWGLIIVDISISSHE